MFPLGCVCFLCGRACNTTTVRPLLGIGVGRTRGIVGVGTRLWKSGTEEHCNVHRENSRCGGGERQSGHAVDSHRHSQE